MKERLLIAKRPDLVAECEQLGVTLKRRSKPEAASLAGRFRYCGETGVIFGPRGKALKPVANRGAYRVGVWHDGTSVRVGVGRLAFALQHGRWPVGVMYLNGDTSDSRAENLIECGSQRLKSAKLAASYGEPEVARGLAHVSPIDLRARRGAWSRGLCLPDELKRIERLLASGVLKRHDRLRLEQYQARFLAALEPCFAGVREAERFLMGGRKARSVTSAPLACGGAGPSGPEKRRKRLHSAAGFRALKLMSWRMARQSSGGSVRRYQ